MRRHLPRIIPIAFSLLVLVFLGVYLNSIDFSRLSDLSPDWRFLLIAVITGIGSIYWGAFVWTMVLRGLGARDARYSVELIHVYAKSWLGRYIPGTAPWILGKIYFASRYGISKSKLAVSSLLEGGIQILVLLIISASMLIADRRLDIVSSELKLAMAAIIAAGIVCLIPPVFNRLIGLGFTALRRGPFPSEHHVRGRVVATGVGLHAVGALISGVSLYFIAKTVYPDLGYAEMLFVMAAANLAGAAGMLAVFVPSGLGVREAVQLALLSLVMPTEFALVVTVATRLWSVAIDVLTLGIATAAKRYARRRDNPMPGAPAS